MRPGQAVDEAFNASLVQNRGLMYYHQVRSCARVDAHALARARTHLRARSVVITGGMRARRCVARSPAARPKASAHARGKDGDGHGMLFPSSRARQNCTVQTP